jgi:uncharacterized cupredoxin-like copper-binding protein
MKLRLFRISRLLFLLVVLAACGGISRNTGMNMQGSPMPSGTPTGNALMTTVQVRETEYTIAASVTSFTLGTTYHFVVTNEGKTAHEFMMLPKSEGSMRGMPMGDMDTMALASISHLGPGETKTLDYTFPQFAADSHPEFACYLPGHYEEGMKLGIAVKA